MIAQPLVTVVLPTHNRCSLLPSSVRSVLAQTWKDLEILVVDDASTDGTLDFLRSCSDERLRWIRTERRFGAAVARNIGIAESRGEYIAFQDSDAEWESEKLEVQMERLLCPVGAPDAVVSAFWREKGVGRVLIPSAGSMPSGQQVDYRQLLRENIVDTPSLVSRKEPLIGIGGFDENLPRFQDWDLGIRLARHCRLEYMDLPLHVTRFQENSISADNAGGCNALLHIVEKFKAELLADRMLLAHHSHKIGISLMRLNDRKEGIRYFQRAVAADSLNMKYSLSLFVARCGTSLYKLMLNVLERKSKSV